MSEQTATTAKHVSTLPFNGFQRPQQREETHKWPFNNKFPAVPAERADDELSRRIKWPTDLNSLGIDSIEAFEKVPRSGLTVPLHFPVARESPSPTIPTQLSSNIPSHLVQTTIASTPSTTSATAINDKNHNPNDATNEMANIVSNVIDIIANATHMVTNISNVSVPGVPAHPAQPAIPNGFVPEIYIDENGIFQIIYVRRTCAGRNNGTVSIEMFATNAISPSANNASLQSTNTTSSINAELDEAAINSYDAQQFELDVRFVGPNESVKDSNRDNATTTVSSSDSDNSTNNAIHVNVEKSDVNNSSATNENEHR